MFSLFFAGENVAEVDLDKGHVDRQKCVTDGKRRVRERSGIDDRTIRRVRQPLDQINQLSFMVVLMPRQIHPKRLAPVTNHLLDLMKRDRAIKLRFAGAEEIEVGAVENRDPH